MDYLYEGKWEEIILEPSGDTLPVGSIAQFGGKTAPTNWLFCNGQAVSRETYKELFSVIGTTYGDGDGSTTFNVPDFIGRVPVGLDEEDTDFDTLGETGGEKTHKLTISEMPSHNHTGGILMNNQVPGGGRYYFQAPGTTNGTNFSNSLKIGETGGNQPHNNMQPYTVTNFIIKAKQSVGLVGAITDNINDTNNNAVPTCGTVKNYVDKKQTYSTDEIVVGKWIDGKPIYRKVVDFGALPNNSAKAIPTGLDHKKINLIALYGIAKDSNGTQFTINQSRINSLGSQIGTYLNSINELVIEVGTDRSSFSAFVTLEYTKQ